jgi:hypothetical protein
MKMFLVIFVALVTCNKYASAQTLDGKWRWTIKPSAVDMQTDDYILEFDLKQTGENVAGTRTLYLQDYPPVIIAVEGKINTAKELMLKATRTLQYKLPDSVFMAKDFVYSLKWDGNNFQGTYFPREDTMKMKIPGFVNTEKYNAVYKISSHAIFGKVPDTAYNPFKKLFPQLQTDIQHTITIPDGDVKIDLYDNGTVDGDIITVWVNGDIVSQHKKLSLAPITINIKKADLQDNTMVIMQAENLGDIPPNTALMLITVAGGKRYDLNLSSTLEKQAAVILKKEPAKQIPKK